MSVIEKDRGNSIEKIIKKLKERGKGKGKKVQIVEEMSFFKCASFENLASEANVSTSKSLRKRGKRKI